MSNFLSALGGFVAGGLAALGYGWWRLSKALESWRW
jgi:hypothetical protein